ncbi:hypothetical protein HOD96_02845, partial [Candidatus Falkowbacteria bacterium]|nr:hypothetical protein [Candidatus Falkowbacteria bacterium]
CEDLDGDGHANPICGGDDCDDTNPDINPGEDEICGDGIDNDCDGVEPSIGGACTVGINGCQETGIFICDPSDLTGPAICNAPTPQTPQPEICDGIDNDCDWTCDNNVTDSPPLNDNQEGVCLGSTKICAETCGSGGNWINNYGPHIPNWEAVEVSCDTLDNDCDGVVDGPGVGNWGRGCYLGASCQKGRIKCDLSGEFCHNVYNDPADPEYIGADVLDYCCSGVAGSAELADGDINDMPFTIERALPEDYEPIGAWIADHGGLSWIDNSYHCDTVCHRVGGICVGVGLNNPALSRCVSVQHDVGDDCDNTANQAANDCQARFGTYSGTDCFDGPMDFQHTFYIGETACYCL